MKARTENGQIKIYKSLPTEFVNDDGSVTINFNNAPTSVLEAKGFYDVVRPSIDKNIEYYGSIEWDADNSQFKYPKVAKTFSETLTELKDKKKQAVKDLANIELAKTDWYVTRKADLGTAIPSEIQTERSNIRTKVTERETEINALTTKKNVAKWTPILFDPPAIDTE